MIQYYEPSWPKTSHVWTSVHNLSRSANASMQSGRSAPLEMRSILPMTSYLLYFKIRSYWYRPSYDRSVMSVLSNVSKTTSITSVLHQSSSSKSLVLEANKKKNMWTSSMITHAIYDLVIRS